MTHPHANREYAEWVAEVFKQNESRNLQIIDEVGTATQKDWEILLTLFPVGG